MPGSGVVEPIRVSAIIFFSIFGGAVLGMWLRGVLPEHHLDAATKDLIKLSVTLIGTMAAMLLGLLVASAKSSYDARRSELTQMAAQMILLDRALAHYGPETGETRAVLKTTAAGMLDRIWTKNSKDPGGPGAGTSGEVLFDRIQELAPQNDSQRALKSQVESMAFNLGQVRWLLFEQSGSSISWW